MTRKPLKRVINYPKRGIGDTSVDKIIVAADQHGITPWEVIVNLANTWKEKYPAQ
jgi:superfamily I DNA/RNA helicase